MFDEWHYWRPQAEGVELGHRLRNHGRRIVLDPGATATHLKRWTLPHLLAVDLFLIGIPWMRLLFQERSVTTTRAPSLRATERTSTALTGISLLCALGTFLSDWTAWPVMGALSATAMLFTNVGFFRYAARELGVGFVVATLPLHVLHYGVNAVAVGLAWLLHETVGEPQREASEAALAEVGAEMWPPVPQRRASDAWQ